MFKLGNTSLTVLLVIALYLTSTIMVLYNKYMINFCPKNSEDIANRTFIYKTVDDVPTRCPGQGFPYPLTIATQQFMQHLLLGVVLVHGFKIVPMPEQSKKEWWMIHIQGVCVGIFVGLANLSFQFLEASLFEEQRQVATVFTLLIGMAFGLEKQSWKQMLVISMIAGGVGLAVAGEASLDGQWLGVIWVLQSCFLTAFSNVQVQVQVQEETKDKNIPNSPGTSNKKKSSKKNPDSNKQLEERTLLYGDMTSSSDGTTGNWENSTNSTNLNVAVLSEVPPLPSNSSIEINMDEELIRTPILSIASHPMMKDMTELELTSIDNEDSLLDKTIEHEEEEEEVDSSHTSVTTTSRTNGHQAGKIHPIIILYLHSPASVLALMPFALILESSYVNEAINTHSRAYITNVSLFILFGGVVAFGLQYIHYKLTAVTSAVTLCVVGTCKTVVVIAAGVLTFKNSLSAINIIGFSICFLGLQLYGMIRSGQIRK